MRSSLCLFGFFALATAAFAQTTSGTSATIVVPVIAQTSSFGSEVTVYNPNASAITVNPVFYDAQNTASPGAKSCTSLSVGANVSKAFTVASQCALPTGSNFGLLVLSESTGTNRFYGYARTQTPQGIGFSTEGFPIENFNDQIQHATGLKRVAASGGLPAYQTNCFVATLGDAVSYELRLFDGGTNTQLGSTLSGSLAAFQQFRYLDVFAKAGVAAGNKTNVRGQFTNLTGANKKLIGFCTVQENTSFSADFRIAKSYGGTPQNAFVQGGNAFGTTALLGTTDAKPLSILMNGAAVMHYLPGTTDTNAPVASPNLVGGFVTNAAGAFSGQTVAGGGMSGNGCYEPTTNTDSRSCANQTANDFATVGGGYGNLASGLESTIAGGEENTASGVWAVVGGGIRNVAAGSLGATVAGGEGNTAAQEGATVGGGDNNNAGFGATVAGGDENNGSGVYAAIVGGQQNIASGEVATVAGGSLNMASGPWSFAAGHGALADTKLCAMFGLWSSGATTTCFGAVGILKVMGDNGFSVDYGTPTNPTGAGGGSRWLAIGPNKVLGGLVPVTIATWNGAYLSDAGVWVAASSSKSSKTDFDNVDVSAVLKGVLDLPITTWRYKQGEGSIRHMGPMAEDFWQAFHIGYGDQTIADLDARGVEFAAIQGLHRLVQEKDAQIETQQREIADLRDRVSQVETLRGELDEMKSALAKLTGGDARVLARTR